MKSELFTPSDSIYLLAHSIGKLPVTTAEHCQRYFFTPWQSGDDTIWPHWLEQIERFNAALGRLFNTDASAFCPQTNISSGLSKVLSGLPKSSERNVILMTENDFPSVGFVLQQAERLGFSIRLIDKNANVQDPDVWKQALCDDIRCVFITHVHYNTNTLVPVSDITTLARERDIVSMVDVAQSAGIVPIDLQHWNADIVFGSCIKWLCGGPGAGFVWVNPDLVKDLEPIDTGWFSHADPFEFDIHHFEYAEDSKRFWGGTPSVLPYITATHSIELLNDIGIEKVRAYNRVLTNRVLDGIDSSCAVSPLDGDLRGGTLVLKFDDQDTVVKKLQAANISFDAREYGIRLSPHIYTKDAEIDLLLDCLR